MYPRFFGLARKSVGTGYCTFRLRNGPSRRTPGLQQTAGYVRVIPHTLRSRSVYEFHFHVGMHLYGVFTPGSPLRIRNGVS